MPSFCGIPAFPRPWDRKGVWNIPRYPVDVPHASRMPYVGQRLIDMSWAAYSSTSSLSRSVQVWLAESSGTKVVSMSISSFIYIPPFVPQPPGIVAVNLRNIHQCYS